MTTRELNFIARLFDSVNQIAAPERVSKNVVEALMGFTGSEVGIIVDVPATMNTQALAAVYVHPFKTEAFSRANNAYFWKNPILPYAQSGTRSRSYEYHSILGTVAYHNTEFYADCFKCFELDNAINYDLCDGDGRLRWGVGLAFAKGHSVPRKIHQVLNALSVPLCRALENNFSWAAALRDKNAVDALLDASNDAVIALNPQGLGPARLVAASGAAAKILDLSVEFSRNLHLHELLRLASKAIGAKGGRVRWQARDGRVFHLVSIASSQTMPKALLVRLVPVEQAGKLVGVDPLLSARAGELGLTPRQIEVVALLALGLGNGEIAHRLGIKERTICVHVHEIYTRLNVSNRVEAVNKLNAKSGAP